MSVGSGEREDEGEEGGRDDMGQGEATLLVGVITRRVSHVFCLYHGRG